MEKEYLIKKWLNNELTPSEKEAFDAMEDSDFHKDIIENAAHFKASHFSNAAHFDQVKSRLTEKEDTPKLGGMQLLLRLTGVIVVAIGIYFLLFANKITQIETLASQKASIELPDATLVNLNALTEIKYSKKNWDNKREIELKGEAFFKVAKGKVFDVITSEGVVTVVGTEFNVKQRGTFFEVTCYEGIVRVTTPEHEKELRVGDSFRILNDIVSSTTTQELLPEWTSNRSRFNSVPFSEVVSELERQYNVEIEYDSAYKDRLFNGGFVHDSLEFALQSITEPLTLSYTIESNFKVSLTKSER